jgi:hypothetical protein
VRGLILLAFFTLPFWHNHQSRAEANLQSFSEAPDDLVLHFDHFPGIYMLNPETHPASIPLDGAPNFRIEQGGKIFGTGLPEKSAISDVLRSVRTSPHEKMVWLIMRGEPVLYLDGIPYTIRSKADPFKNLMLNGIIPEAIETLESRLAEHLKGTLKKAGAIQALNESSTGEVFSTLIKPVHIETTREALIHEASREGEIEYFRIPMLDEAAPHPGSIDEVISSFKKAHLLDHPEHLKFIVNCHMGRGRTTFAQAMLYRMLGHSHEEAMNAASQIFHLRDVVHKPKYSSMKAPYQARYEMFEHFSKYLDQKTDESFSEWFKRTSKLDPKDFHFCDRELHSVLQRIGGPF